jgi:AcrR family transcriptional regulator
MAEKRATNTRPVGRPRRYDEATERKLLLDAGMKVMRRNGFADASLADVLEAAQVSTRAFYRHFETKDALLVAMFDRDAEAVSARLRDAVATAATARDALDAWLDEYLDLFANPRRASRVRLLASPAARGAVGYHDALQRMMDAQAAPLAEALARGSDDGTLTSTDPSLDARTILAVVEVVGPSLVAGECTLQDARAHVAKFCGPALGLAGV